MEDGKTKRFGMEIFYFVLSNMKEEKKEEEIQFN